MQMSPEDILLFKYVEPFIQWAELGLPPPHYECNFIKSKPELPPIKFPAYMNNSQFLNDAGERLNLAIDRLREMVVVIEPPIREPNFYDRFLTFIKPYAIDLFSITLLPPIKLLGYVIETPTLWVEANTIYLAEEFDKFVKELEEVVRKNYVYLAKTNPPIHRTFGYTSPLQGWNDRIVYYNVKDQMKCFQENYSFIASHHVRLNKPYKPLFILHQGALTIYPVFDTCHYPNAVVPLSLMNMNADSRICTIGLAANYDFNEWTSVKFHLGFFCQSGEIISWDELGNRTTFNNGKWRINFGITLEPSSSRRFTVLKDFVPYWENR
jgi:hypothetical protein